MERSSSILPLVIALLVCAAPFVFSLPTPPPRPSTEVVLDIRPFCSDKPTCRPQIRDLPIATPLHRPPRPQPQFPMADPNWDRA